MLGTEKFWKDIGMYIKILNYIEEQYAQNIVTNYRHAMNFF